MRLFLRFFFFVLSLAFGGAAYGGVLRLMSKPFSFGGPRENMAWIVALTLGVLLPGAIALAFSIHEMFPR
jgi:hypothetical protein